MQKLYTLLLLLIAFGKPQIGHTQCAPQLLNCQEPILSCDLSANNASYWNDPHWWDAANQLHDLAENKTELRFSVRDTCPGGTGPTVRCLLFLDLDADGTQETVVDSETPPPSGIVFFDNASSPNYIGGTPSAFDKRNLPDTQKWRFALNSTIAGDTTHFSLLWTNDDAPGVFELPELPQGTHRARWIVTAALGSVQNCEKPVQVKDCKPPSVTCINGLNVNIMPTKQISLIVADFLLSTDDNTTPTGRLKTGIRKKGLGTGFPVDANGNPAEVIVFDCDDLGKNDLEVWSKDAAGNANYCETFVDVQENFTKCSPELGLIAVCAKDACMTPQWLEYLTWTINVNSANKPPYTSLVTGACVEHDAPLDATVTITPSDFDDPLDGISQLDVFRLEQQIKSGQPFPTPYQWIAADANNDNVVDSLDVLECERLLLGIYTHLPNNSAWRFVDKNYVFPWPNPLSAPFPESITVNTSNPIPFALGFVAVRVCDVSCTGTFVGTTDGELGLQHHIGTPQPNPTRRGAMLPLQLASDERVLLELHDLTGRLLFRSENHFPQGASLLEIPDAAMPLAGVYLWRVRAGDVVRAGKIVLE
ncbi:MAG: hypothetical protein ABMA02_01255 [Saprospiraceae bacterium]